MTCESNRTVVSYENLSRKWSHIQTTYNKQYYNIYVVRLKQMEPYLLKSITAKWGDKYPVFKLHKLSGMDEKCVVIGTLFKNQVLKPSILKELSEGNQLLPQPILTHFTDKSDELYIEDELQRYRVVSALECSELVTGISCALLGSADDNGRFITEDYVFANFQPQIPRPSLERSAYVVFLSGLELINAAKFTMNLRLLTYWLSGLLGDLDDIDTCQIVRLIIAGGNIRSQPEKAKPSISLISKRSESSQNIDAVKELDKYLLEFAKLIDVDVMPGENDPSNHILPQKPMHYCMFPAASAFKSLNQVSNPYHCSLGGVRILGTSGQPINDILKFSNIVDSLDALESCLRWNHIAPTAPDTLGCFPFFESDPFIIDECPHVFFAGNQKEFAVRQCKGDLGQPVTLLSIPQFSTTLQACVLNLKTLNCNNISFNT